MPWESRWQFSPPLWQPHPPYTITASQNISSSVGIVAKASKKKSVYKYTKANLNMRKGVGTKYKVTKVLKKGTKVKIKSSRKGWNKVIASGKTGWVSGKYLSYKKPKTTKAKTKYRSNSLQNRAKSYLRSFGCGKVPVTWVNSKRFNGQVNLEKRTMKLNKKMPSYRLKYVTAHECHHIKQAKAYNNDWNRLFKDMKRAHPGVNKMTALERNADCATLRLGIKQWNYTKNCSSRQKAVAKRIWNGKRAY